MTLAFWFWLFMALWVVFGIWRARADVAPYFFAGSHILVFILFLILGWGQFGSPIK
jgi:hypothetical protein